VVRVLILPAHPPAFEADLAAKLKGIRRTYETASNKDDRAYHLLAALFLCGTFRPLPDWLFKALSVELKAKAPKEPNLHGGRWLLVREGKQRGRTWEQAYQYASDQAAGTPWEGASRTMEESYKIFEAKLRGRKRKPRRR
jgi:hypothetical protein